MTPKRAEQIYNTLMDYVVELDPDPVARGPLYLQDLISKVRGYLNAVSIFMQEAHRERHALESRLDSLETAFRIAADELLTSDGRVMRLPNIDDRKAMVNLILSTELQEIEKTKGEIRSLGHVEKAIRLRQKELDNTMSAIRLQRSLIQAELRTGSFYGDESDKSRGDAWGRGAPAVADEDFDDDELSRLVAEAEAQIEQGAVADEGADEDEEDGAVADEEEGEEEDEGIEAVQPEATEVVGLGQLFDQAMAEMDDEEEEPPPKPKPTPKPDPGPPPESEAEEAEDPAVERFLDAGDDDDDLADLFDAVSGGSGV